MAVVINEFEVTSQPSPAQPAGAPAAGGGSAISPDKLQEIDKALHKEIQRERRLLAH